MRHLLDLRCLGALLLLLWAELLLAQKPARQDPIAEDEFFLGGSDIDFGVLIDRARHLDTLWLRNVSGEPLLVQNVRSSCGCTAASWPQAPVAPETRFGIPLEFRCLRVGYVEKKVEIWIAGRRRPLKATVFAECTAAE